MVGMAQREAQKVLEAKRKYFEKALSDTAIEVNFLTSLRNIDETRFRSDITLSDTLFSSLLSIYFFGIPLSDTTPWVLTFTPELPDFDELLRGIMIKFESFDMTLQFPFLKDIDETIRYFLVDEVAGNIISTRGGPLIVGVTKYGEGYVDPEAVREFLRSTLYAYAKKDISITELKNRLDKVGKTLGILPELIEDVFNRLVLIGTIKEKAATWDYAWWDVSEWAEEEDGTGKVEFETYDGEKVKIEYDNLLEAEAGGYWDLSYWDNAYWIGDEPPYNQPYKYDEKTYKSNIDQVRDTIFTNFIRCYIYTGLGVGNYQRAWERRKYYRSSRTETYALPFSHRLRIESLVKNYVLSKDPGCPPWKIRLYQSAVLEIYGKLFGVHRWGTEMEVSMSEEEFRNYWLDKWEAEGLDRAILEGLYGTLKPIVVSLGLVRQTSYYRFIRWKYRRWE